MKDYIKLLKFLKGNVRLFILAVVIMIFASLLEGIQLPLIVPLLDRVFNDKEIILPNENLPEFVHQFVAYLNHLEPITLFWGFIYWGIGLILLKNIVIFLYKFLMSDVSQRTIRGIRGTLYVKLQNLSLDYYSKKRTGELISRITNDVSTVENAMSYALIDLFRQTSMIIINVVIAFSIFPKAAFVMFIIFPFIGIPLSRIGRKLKKLSTGQQEKMADINSFLLETISGVKVVKAFNAEEYETKRFEKENYAYYKVIMKAVKRSIVISPLTEVFGSICAMTIIAWLGRMVMNNELSTGIFFLFFGVIMSTISPVKKLGNVNVIIQQALAANDRIHHILDATVSVKEPDNPIALPELQDRIELKDITFQYDEDDQTILKDLNLTIEKGQLVAIVGPTGVGKTTLVNFVPRFYDPIKGKVMIDGMDLKKVSFESLRGQIGIVAQESFLFNDTVKANIAYGRRDATQSEIEEAAKKALAHQFIEEMPQGYDTTVGDRGFRLSGGEKQRISIARAILKNPPILILDEATSQLDSQSEKFVQEAVDKLMQGRTVIVIAHRLSTIKKADKIVCLDKQGIVGEGTHEELLKSCELYQKLHEMQFRA